jgi:hypothetical protein
MVGRLRRDRRTKSYVIQHIVKRKTVVMTGYINILNGYRAIDIYLTNGGH